MRRFRKENEVEIVCEAPFFWGPNDCGGGRFDPPQIEVYLGAGRPGPAGRNPHLVSAERFPNAVAKRLRYLTFKSFKIL